MNDTVTTTIGFSPTVDVDLSQPLPWPNPDGTVTWWPPIPAADRLKAEREIDAKLAGYRNSDEYDDARSEWWLDQIDSDDE